MDKKAIYATIAGLLLSGNIFFIKRLVDSIDKSEEAVWSMRQELVVHGIKIECLMKKLEEKKRIRTNNSLDLRDAENRVEKVQKASLFCHSS
jgi:hypothetical protein